MMKSRWRKKNRKRKSTTPVVSKKKTNKQKELGKRHWCVLARTARPKSGTHRVSPALPNWNVLLVFFSTGFYWLFTVVGCPFLGSIRVFFARYDRVLTVFLTVFLGVARFWLCPRVYYRALLGFTGFHCVLPGFTGFYWVLLGFTGFYWVILGFTGFS